MGISCAWDRPQSTNLETNLIIVPIFLGVDDKRLDEILADGIQGQSLEDNKVIMMHFRNDTRNKRH